MGSFVGLVGNEINTVRVTSGSKDFNRLIDYPKLKCYNVQRAVEVAQCG